MARTAATSPNHMAIIDIFPGRHRNRSPVTRVTAPSSNHRYWTPATRRQSLFPSGYRGCSTHRGPALVVGPLFLCTTGRCCCVVRKGEKGGRAKTPRTAKIVAFMASSEPRPQYRAFEQRNDAQRRGLAPALSGPSRLRANPSASSNALNPAGRSR